MMTFALSRDRVEEAPLTQASLDPIIKHV